MNSSKNLAGTFLLLVLISAIYRVIPDRPWGFAPQWAIAIFAGAVIKDKKWAFIIPVLSMFVSDLFYQVLYKAGLTAIPGFYEGQWQNYLLFALLVFVGFAVKKINTLQVVSASVVAPTLFFFLSNFLVWASNADIRGLNRPKTLEGLISCYVDGIPFYRNSILATMVFSAILFGSYLFLKKYQEAGRQINA